MHDQYSILITNALQHNVDLVIFDCDLGPKRKGHFLFCIVGFVVIMSKPMHKITHCDSNHTFYLQLHVYVEN